MEPKLHLKNELPKAKAYHWALAFAGFCVFLWAFINLPFSSLGVNFTVIAVVTILLGSKIAIDFQVFKSNISLADIFIYLTALLFGAETATVLIAVEAFITSSKFTKRLEFKMFSAGILAISIFFSIKISGIIFGPIVGLNQKGLSFQLISALAVIVLCHYLINTTLIAVSLAIRSESPVIKVWREFYLWMFIPFLASGAVALAAINAIFTSGFFGFLIVLPIIAIIYFSYYSQQGKIQAVNEKAAQAEQHLLEMRESEARFRAAFSNAPIGIALISNEGNWLQVNESVCRIFGCTESEFLQKNLQELIHPEDLVMFLHYLGFIIQGRKQSFQAELRYFNWKSEEIWTQTSVSRLNDSENSRLICQIQDITARHKAEEKLRHDAFYDPLTNLGNRNFFMQKLNEAVHSKPKQKNGLAVVFVDLDRFRLVNDSLGHTVGDRLLKAVSKRLKKCLPDDCTIARFGSDEFLILLEKEINGQKIIGLAEEIKEQIGLAFNLGSHEIDTRASLGIVMLDINHETAEDLLREADTALNIAKKKGGNCMVIFDQTLREKTSVQMQLEKDLHRAVERGEFYLVYQPILALNDKTVVGFEALIRWNHPKFGFVSPADFIPLAEENGTIVEVGKFVLNEACRQFAGWQNGFEGKLPLFISVNVSAKQLLQKQLFTDVLEALERHRLEPRQLKLEITESVVVENTELVVSILKQFRAVGLNLSMDDFGTGYSSLSYLHQLPVNTLKIDRSFVSRMSDQNDRGEIIKTIILLAKNLRLEVVAEGIETLEQYQALKKMGCEYGQGYLFAKPMSVDEATAYVNERFEDFNGLNKFDLEAQTSFLEH